MVLGFFMLRSRRGGRGGGQVKRAYDFSKIAGGTLALLVCLPAWPQPTGPGLRDMQRLSEMLDQIERQEFETSIRKANACITARQFACAQVELAKAAKAAQTRADRGALEAAKIRLDSEQRAQAMQEQQAEQARLREVQERWEQRERAEELAQEERRRRAQEEGDDDAQDPSSGSSVGAYLLRRGRETAAAASRINNQTAQVIAQADRERAQSEARRQAQARAQAEEASRVQEQVRREATARLEKESLERARQVHLAQLRAGIRLGAKNCFGQIEVGGSRPVISGANNLCVDVAFTAYCPGASTGQAGVLRNFVGMDNGCYGDTVTIQRQACDASLLRLEVDAVRPCGE